MEEAEAKRRPTCITLFAFRFCAWGPARSASANARRSRTNYLPVGCDDADGGFLKSLTIGEYVNKKRILTD